MTATRVKLRAFSLPQCRKKAPVIAEADVSSRKASTANGASDETVGLNAGSGSGRRSKTRLSCAIVYLMNADQLTIERQRIL